jgi:hypothetical protein
LGTEIVTEEKSPTSRALDWVAGQPFNNVLLIAIFLSIGWIGHYSMTTAIPAHLEQIQNGYESLHESHRDERERTQQMYDRWMNRTGDSDLHNGSKVANKQTKQ